MGVLYVIACAAPPAADLATLIELAKADGWDPYVITTPLGRRFVDEQQLVALTGSPVRSEWRMPGDPKGLPKADAAVVAPATLNTVSKWALGITDTYAVGTLAELMGFDVPIVAVPLLKRALAAHPAFPAHLDALRGAGVRVLYDPDAADGQRMPSWERVMDELRDLLEDPPTTR